MLPLLAMRCSSCGSDAVSALGRCGVCGHQQSEGDTRTFIPGQETPTGFPESSAPTGPGFSNPNAPTGAGFANPNAPTTAGISDATATTGFGAAPLPPGVGRGAAASGPLAAGQAFGHRYHIIRVLGAGGMGVVYQAFDSELGVAVALKVIRPEVLQDPGSAGEVERRFKRELVLARQVTHKNVVRIHDLGELQGVKYLTMPFVEGENLADLLKREGKLPIPRALVIAKQVASGLLAAHEVGVVHRDLKPENIMIAADGTALIMDFGISRSVSGTGTATAMGAVMGTLEYMAPEQAQGTPVDQRADIYSFGLVVYDMLTGRQRVARRDNPMSEMMSRMTQPPPPVRTLHAGVPEAFERVLMRCLTPSPDARYATTQELVNELDHLAPDGHLLVTPAAPAPAASSRAPIIALTAALVLVVAGGGFWIWKNGRGAAAPAAPIEPVSVLIANFENRANEPLFDGLVEQALGVGIEGASFVTAYPRRDALRLVPTLNRAALDEETARLIAIREGIDRIVSGSIAADGGRYKLAVRIIDPQAPPEGNTALVLDTEASDKNDVLNAVGRMAAKVRSGLGDATVDANQVRDTETFTAASLEAAHEYVRAQELQWAGKYEEAIAAYKKAVELDDTLGRAYAGLGALSSNLGRRAEAEEYFKLALGRLDRMTDREKFRTRSGYFLHVQNPAKAREELEALVKQFPADSTALSNLAVAASQSRDMTRALELGRKASDIYPNNVLRRNNVALFAMYAGEFDAAEKQAKSVMDINPDFVKAYYAMAVSQLGLGRSADARATWQVLKAKPAGADLATLGLADLAMYEGRLSEAATTLETALTTPAAGRPENTTARMTLTLAEVRELQGRGPDAARLAEQALATRKAGDASVAGIAYLAGIVLAKAGRAPRAMEIAAELGNRIDEGARMYGKLLEGEVNLRRGDAVGAFKRFEEAQQIGDSWLGRFGLGRAQLEAGEFAAAEQEFDRCLRKRNGEATNVLLDDIPTYRLVPPARYYMGRAQEGLGSASAADHYKAFLAIKENGDEQGLVADARRRLRP